MATFNDLQHKIKDAVLVDMEQRYTPQEVKFINRKNEFYGKFYGKFYANKFTAKNAELSNCIIYDTDGVSVNISELKTTDEMWQCLNDLSVDLYELSTVVPDWINDAVLTSSIKLSNDLVSTITNVSSSLDTRISANEMEIVEIKKKQIGAVSYQGILSVMDDMTTFHDVFYKKFYKEGTTTPEEVESKILEKGWMWIVKTNDKVKHYYIEGQHIEYGDYLLLNSNTAISSITKNNVDIIDVMDFDLSCDDHLDPNSKYPLQNKVITREISSLKQTDSEIYRELTSYENLETQDRISSDFRLFEQLTSYMGQETSERMSEDERIEDELTSYVKTINERLVSDEISIIRELENRIEEDIKLYNRISSLSSDVYCQIHQLTSDLTSETNYRISSDRFIFDSLTTLIHNVDSDLQDYKISNNIALTSEIESRKTADYNISVALKGLIGTEKQEREEADTELFDTLTSYIQSETTARKNADTILRNDLGSYRDSNNSRLDADELSIISEIENRIVEDSKIQEQIDQLTSDLDTEIEDRKTADKLIYTALTSYEKSNDEALASEVCERISEDTRIENELTTYIRSNNERFDELTAYVRGVSATAEYEIKDIKQNLIGAVKYMGHITLHEDLSSKTISNVFEEYYDGTGITHLSNGWMYEVTFGDDVLTSTYELSTADVPPIALTPKDYILIDNHELCSQGVAISNINRDTIDIIDVVDEVYVKRSEYEKDKENLSAYTRDHVSSEIGKLDYSKQTLTGSTILKSISETDGKISIETRKLSADEIENIESYVNGKITTKIEGLDYTGYSLTGTNTLASLSETDGKISYTTRTLDQNSIYGLPSTLKHLEEKDYLIADISGNVYGRMYYPKWTQQNDNRVYSFAFGNGILVCGGQGALPCTIDGNNFSVFDVKPGNWKKVIQGPGGKFIAGSGSSKGIIYSDDGTFWSNTNISVDNILDFAYDGRDRVLAITNAETILSSSNGHTWETIDTSVPPGGFCSIEYGECDGKRIFVCSLGCGLVFSLDGGKTWHDTNINFKSWNNIVFGNGRFVAASSVGDVAWSDNGEEWNTKSLFDPYSGKYLGSIEFIDGKFFAGQSGGYVLYSSDGENWIESSEGVKGVYAFVHAFGKYFACNEYGIYSAIPNEKKEISYKSDVQEYVKNVSSDISTYMSCYVSDKINEYDKGKDYLCADSVGLVYGVSDPKWRLVEGITTNWVPCTYGNGMFVAGSNSDSRIWYSKDGINWKQSYTNTGRFYSLAYGNGMFVAGSNSNSGIWYSKDGINWKQSHTNTGYFYSLAYGDGVYVAGKYTKGILYSNNGIDWYNSNLSSNTFYAFTHVGGKFFAAAINNGGILSSVNGEYWSPTNKTDGTFRSIAYGNGRFVVGSYDGKGILYSDDGTNWNKSNLTSKSFSSLAYYNQKFYAGTISNNGVYYSDDGINWTRDDSDLSSGTWYSFASDGDRIIGTSSNKGIWYSIFGGKKQLVYKKDMDNVMVDIWNSLSGNIAKYDSSTHQITGWKDYSEFTYSDVLSCMSQFAQFIRRYVTGQ